MSDHDAGCGCCGGTGAQTPLRIHNRPGLPALHYRVGTHSTFSASMRAGLSSASRPALAALTARENDFAAALVDAWATVGDVVTFYQERIANESYLRTATERLSVIELARAVGYEMAPGVAASTHLAFTLEDVPGAPAEITLTPGTRVQSVPGPGERPQTFETVETVAARPEWNALRPRMRRPGTLSPGAVSATLAGVATRLVPGDVLLFVGPKREVEPTHDGWEVRQVVSVDADAAAGRTVVGWTAPLDRVDGESTRLFVFRQRAALFGAGAPDWRMMPAELQARFLADDRTPEEIRLQTPFRGGPEWPFFHPRTSADGGVELDALYPTLVTPSWVWMQGGGQEALYRADGAEAVGRADFGISARVTRVRLDHDAHLDGPAPSLIPGAIRPVSGGTSPVPIGGGVVGPRLDEPRVEPEKLFPLRETAVLMGSEELALAEEEITAPIQGAEVELGAPLARLDRTRRVLVTGIALPSRRILGPDGTKRCQELSDGEPAWQGERPFGRDEGMTGEFMMEGQPVFGAGGRASVAAADAPGIPDTSGEEAGEIATVHDFRAENDPAHPVVVFEQRLRNRYVRGTVRIHANVLLATHGEEVRERLGGGDAGLEYQRFLLKQAPVTYVPRPTAAGAETTLEVRVNGLLWREVPTLHGQGPRDRVYVTRRREAGETVVQFGDGRSGARLPTGRENVDAVYRKGIGRDGNVRARQLSQLLTRPLGVRAVDNPLPASGGVDPETMDAARGSAPRTVVTLDRVVSLADYREFARNYGGVGRAHAVWSWHGGRRGVVLTIAGASGEVPPSDGAVATGLAAALAAAGDPHVPVRVLPYTPIPFHLTALLRRDADRLDDDVRAAVEAALRDRFRFQAREFGQSVHLSEVVAAMQGVPGVRAVDLNTLHAADAKMPLLNHEIGAYTPPEGGQAGAACPAELLTLALRPGDLTVTA
ncbi:putative baseplate assembly protein [Longimicrobium terrae]|uniref:Baseplate assembly protein n=1 Tax=Longimicrobium terrae TaxID=1639882 RepID=A0A841GPK5_9BACT|nr:putative baseplate assembly protein [Longimicrobium terrae]MBB4634907.1 hypothetical protein [Longimicrobium terrae]MBB6069302.1 hypothetical protein [Longimicrobium terrae]NNC31889.1 putative baseplate assembly protein [Longimicrobium terrae]